VKSLADDRKNYPQNVSGAARLFSIRSEFPSAWAQFKRVAATPAAPVALQLDIRKEHYPYWTDGLVKKVRRAELFASGVTGAVKVTRQIDDANVSPADAFNVEDIFNSKLWRCILDNAVPTKPVCEENKPYILNFDNNSMDDLWLMIAWASK
jgi:hypothetical protein